MRYPLLISPTLITLFCLFYRHPQHNAVPALKIMSDTSLKAVCDEAKTAASAATSLFRTEAFKSAANDIRNTQAASSNEQVVSFGKDSLGNILRSPVSGGNINSGVIPPVKNRLADIHIHTNEKPPSSGDLYGFIEQAIKDSGYIRYTLTPAQELYAFVLISKPAAIGFIKTFPKRSGIQKTDAKGITTFYQPTFPAEIIEELDKMKGWSGASDEMALAFMLQKYNTGVALLKLTNSGDFKRLITTEKANERGNTTYILNYCP